MRKNIGLFFAALVCITGQVLGVEGSTVYIAPAWEFASSHWGGGKQQKGSLWGASAGYCYQKTDGFYGSLEFTAMAGKWHGSAGNDPTQEYITEARMGYVGTPAAIKSFTLTPFIGGGSYVFNQTISGSANFYSYFWYIPIGVRLAYEVPRCVSVALVGIGAPTFSGSYKLIKRGHAPTSVLWKVELPVTYIGYLPFSFAVVPFFKDWAYLAHQELIKQRNIYYGCKLAFGYHF